jgi:hypothetical protein
MGPAVAWLSSDRGLLVVGTSLVLGGLGYLWADCLRLWRVRRKMRDLVDLGAVTTFTALIAGSAWAMRIYDSLPVIAVGVAAAALSAYALHRLLAPASRLLRAD